MRQHAKHWAETLCRAANWVRRSLKHCCKRCTATTTKTTSRHCGGSRTDAQLQSSVTHGQGTQLPCNAVRNSQLAAAMLQTLLSSNNTGVPRPQHECQSSVHTGNWAGQTQLLPSALLAPDWLTGPKHATAKVSGSSRSMAAPLHAVLCPAKTDATDPLIMRAKDFTWGLRARARRVVG